MKRNSATNTEIERFSPDRKVGLNESQVKSRTNEGLVNAVKERYSKSYLSIVVSNVCTFFNLLGLAVFIALLCVDAEFFNYVFVLVYIANLAIGITQEIRAKKSIDRLSLLTNKSATVVRDGKETDISPKDIVLDDVVKLSIGNQVPTDCRIMDGDVEVNESLLTGESVSIKKSVGDELLSGSFISSGCCYARAEKVGKENYVETLSAKAKKYKKPHSELMESLKLLIKIIAAVIVPLAILYTVKSFVAGEELNSAVLSTSTLVIGMIPSGMFLLTSLALAVGIIKLAKHNTLVQDLYSLEMLARVDTVCFDKTGTITDGNMTVKDVVSVNGSDTSEIEKILSSMMAALSDDNRTASAVTERFGKESFFSPVNTLPFSSKRKLSAVTFKDRGTFALGASEFVLNKDEYGKIADTVDGYAAEGLRVLILAESKTALSGEDLPKDLKPIAYILIVDNVREDALETVKWFKENGVDIKVISGDNPVTVAEVSKRVGIDGAEKYISLEGVSDEEVAKAATEYTVFGRVSPEQKAILISALKAAGRVTAMMGDGVNDILALKEANCAISVAAGSEAARNVAHLVLTDNNFNSLPKVVYEGRRVINNVQSSSSLYLMKTLFTMILAAVTLILPFTKVYPFTLRQMNLLEFFVIGVPSFFLSLQPNDSRVEGKFINYVVAKSLPAALLMLLSVGVIELLKRVMGFYPDDIPREIYTTMQVFALTFAGIANLYMISRPLNRYRFVLVACCFAVILAAFIVTVVYGIDILGFAAFTPLILCWHHVAIVISIALLNIPLAFALQKLFEFIRKRGGRTVK